MTPLESILQERGIKKTWLAKKVGVSNGTMTRLCSGESKPTIDVALKIARVLGTSIEELWGHLIDERTLD